MFAMYNLDGGVKRRADLLTHKFMPRFVVALYDKSQGYRLAELAQPMPRRSPIVHSLPPLISNINYKSNGLHVLQDTLEG